LIPISKEQYNRAAFLRPNLSTSAPVTGAVTAPVMKPRQYSEATENPYPS
jgi:hypothetical protein